MMQLLTLTRPSKFSTKRIVLYWLSTPSLTFARRRKISAVSEVFTFQYMAAEAAKLP
jgi:hypothetical protein